MSAPSVKLTVDKRIATVTMNRPEKRNALDADMVASLTTTLRSLADDPTVRVIVLAGAGTAFSAGADLEALQRLQAAPAEANLADSQNLARLFRTIHELPKPVLARVNGHAIAGGCGLAAVCDFSIASADARFGFTEVRIGFVPAIISVFLIRKVGESRLREWLLRGAPFSAADAAAGGLISRSVPGDRLDEEVGSLALELASETSPSATAITKRLLADLHGMGREEALSYAVNLNALTRSTEDCRRGVAAFLAKEEMPWKHSDS